MSVGEPQTELSAGATVSRTFNLFIKNFWTLFTPVLIAYLISGALGVPLSIYVSTIPKPPNTGVAADTLNWFSKYIPTLFALAVVTGLIISIVNVIAYGMVIKCSSELIESNKTSLVKAVRFTARKLLSLLAATILLSIIIVLGLIALVIPGIVLGVMFSLTISAIMIENVGVINGMSRSRELVSHRWLKTFAVFLIIEIILGIVSYVASLIASPLKPYNWVLSDTISALIAPILPIALSVHYYSMLARE
jgi:flagellar biosynthesis protein FlhB